MDTKKLRHKGRYMSKLLRHSPEEENLSMDEYGYVRVKELCSALKINREELNWIVENNNKKRFIFGGGYQKDLIRATQGHSFKVKMRLQPIEPPEILYHGTSWHNKDSITKTGLDKINRQHVHLTDDIEIAKSVGLRYAKNENKLWIISIQAKKMWEIGYDFYKTENGVWLTDHVPPKYFT